MISATAGAPSDRDVVEVSVVIPCRGHAASLPPLLDALTRQNTPWPFEVLVVDAEPDDEVRTVASECGAVVVRGAPGLLPGEARDLGAARARGRMLAFIDADCVPDHGWLAAAVATLNQGARLTGGPVADLWRWHPIAVADNLLQFADLPRTRPAGAIHMLPACNLAMRAGDYAELGGFRHVDGVPTGEDVALCERAVKRWPGGIRFSPAMAVRHAGRTRLGGLIRHHFSFGYARGRLGLLLSARQARLAAKLPLAPVLVLRRFAFVLGRVLRYRPVRVLTVLLLTPLLLLGMVVWTVGFRRGLADATRQPLSPAVTPLIEGS
jgi:hypothetical protein